MHSNSQSLNFNDSNISDEEFYDAEEDDFSDLESIPNPSSFQICNSSSSASPNQSKFDYFGNTYQGNIKGGQLSGLGKLSSSDEEEYIEGIWKNSQLIKVFSCQFIHLIRSMHSRNEMRIYGEDNLFTFNRGSFVAKIKFGELKELNFTRSLNPLNSRRGFLEKVTIIEVLKDTLLDQRNAALEKFLQSSISTENLLQFYDVLREYKGSNQGIAKLNKHILNKISNTGTSAELRNNAKQLLSIEQLLLERNKGFPKFNFSIQHNLPNLLDDELWDFYLNNIECTRNSREKIETKDNQDHRYGSTMHLPIWGRPEVEGQMICQKYNIKLHVIEYHPDFRLLHQVIDSSGSQSVEDVDYNEENVVHIINEGNAHFKAIIRQEINCNMDHRSYDSRKIVNSTDSHAFNTKEDNQNYLELIKARKEENETLKEKWKKYVDEKDYYKISRQEVEEIIEGITECFKSREEKKEIQDGLEIMFGYISDSTFPQVYETFSDISFLFSDEGKHISYKELLCIMQSIIKSVDKKRGKELKFWWIIADCSQRNWIGEFILVQIEDHLKRVLNKDEKDKWRDYLYEITNINIIIMFRNKLDRLDRTIEQDKSIRSLTAEQIENVLYLLHALRSEDPSNVKQIDARIEKLDLSEWHYILKQE